MTYTINNFPTNKEVWFAGIRYDNYVDWIGNDNLIRPVFNFRPTNGRLVAYNDVLEFRWDGLGDCSIPLSTTDMNCYVFADTFEEVAQGYNDIIYKYNYKLKMMMHELNFWRIKNAEGVY